MPDEQHGFRKKLSTNTQLSRITETILGFNKNQVTTAVIRYGMAPRPCPQNEMHEHQYPNHLSRIIQSYLRRRTFQVTISEAESSRRLITAGVPQGSTLSALLYAMHTADLPRNHHTEIATYADDTAVLVSSLRANLAATRLQNAMNELHEWFKTWRITINVDKSQAIIFQKKLQTTPALIKLDRSPITWTNTVKYLGVTLDTRLTFGQHITNTVGKAKYVRRQLSPLITRRSVLNAETKLKLYKTILRPIITYAAPIWICAATTHRHKLQTFQNITLRMALNAPWYMRNNQIHNEADTETIDDYIKEMAIKFYDQMKTNVNPTLNITNDYTSYPWKHKRPRMAII